MSNELIGNFSNGAGLIGNLGNAGSGTNNYNDLVNKPSINGVTLAGNKSLSDLGINIPTKVSQLQNDSHYVQQSAIPTKTSQLQNDSGFAYAANLATVATTGSYNNLSDKPTIPAAQVNSDWNSNSGVSQILNKPSLAAVATSGSYDDLTNKPTIPAAQVNSDWNSNSGVSQILNKPSLAAVATSGSYDDLTNKPTIPAAQVNSDWNSNSGVSQILNKPSLAAVATSGNYNDLTNKPDFSTTEITSSCTFTEDISGTNTRVYVKSGMVFIFYQGESTTHASQDDLFTLPSGYRPSNLIYQAFVCNNTGYGNVSINTTGAVKVNQIANGSTAGRIYFSACFPL